MKPCKSCGLCGKNPYLNYNDSPKTTFNLSKKFPSSPKILTYVSTSAANKTRLAATVTSYPWVNPATLQTGIRLRQFKMGYT